MKTPISFYGGKQRLVKTILPLIPDHKTYIELFFGGGAFWVLSQESYGHIFNRSWGIEKNSRCVSKNIKNKIDNFTEDYVNRLRLVQIECDDAIRVIKNFDSENAFFYCDPPYFNSNCGNYKGYTIDNYKELLEMLSGIKGKFLLSSYNSDILNEYKIKHNWKQIEIQQYISMSSNIKNIKYKTEVLTFNYENNNLNF
jgi:DNA adenine methylase